MPGKGDENVGLFDRRYDTFNGKCDYSLTEIKIIRAGTDGVAISHHQV